MEKLYLKDIFLKPITGEWGDEVKNDEEGYPVIRTTNFTNNGEINYDELAYRDIDISIKKNKLLKNGDIIIEKSGGTPKTPVGRVVYFDIDDENYFTNNFTAILRTKNDINSKYVFYMIYYFHKIGVVLKYQNKTTGIINLKLSDYLKNTRIKLPQIYIQNSTVDKLDKLKTLIQTRQDQVQALDDLVDSVFDQMFGALKTNKTRLKNLIKFNNKNINDFENYYDFYYIGVEDIEKDTGNILSRAKVSDVDIKSSKKFFADENILYSRIRPNLNKVALPDFSGLISTEVYVLECSDKINRYFLTHVLRSNRFVKYAMLNSTGANFPRVSQQAIEGYSLYLPPIEKQNHFAAFVEKIEGQKEILNKSLGDLRDLFDSLMQDAFDGSFMK